ncbi:hypothetical protein SARC_17593, partial [Sphaeroforma arctica JP610]
ASHDHSISKSRPNDVQDELLIPFGMDAARLVRVCLLHYAAHFDRGKQRAVDEPSVIPHLYFRFLRKHIEQPRVEG